MSQECAVWPQAACTSCKAGTSLGKKTFWNTGLFAFVCHFHSPDFSRLREIKCFPCVKHGHQDATKSPGNLWKWRRLTQSLSSNITAYHPCTVPIRFVDLWSYIRGLRIPPVESSVMLLEFITAMCTFNFLLLDRPPTEKFIEQQTSWWSYSAFSLLLTASIFLLDRIFYYHDESGTVFYEFYTCPHSRFLIDSFKHRILEVGIEIS